LGLQTDRERGAVGRRRRRKEEEEEEEEGFLTNNE